MVGLKIVYHPPFKRIPVSFRVFWKFLTSLPNPHSQAMTEWLKFKQSSQVTYLFLSTPFLKVFRLFCDVYSVLFIRLSKNCVAEKSSCKNSSKKITKIQWWIILLFICHLEFFQWNLWKVIVWNLYGLPVCNKQQAIYSLPCIFHPI